MQNIKGIVKNFVKKSFTKLCPSLHLINALCNQNLTSEPVSVLCIRLLGARAIRSVYIEKTAVQDLDLTNFDSVALDKTKDVLVEFYAPCKYILITVTVNSFTSILVGKKSFNPFTPEPSVTARVDPLLF